MSLTHRLLALTLVASLPGLAAVGYGSFDLRNTRYAEVRSEAQRNAQVVASEIGQIFDGIESALRAVAETDEVSKLNSTVCTDYVVRVRPNVEPLTSLLVVGLDGNIRCYSEPSSGVAKSCGPRLLSRGYRPEKIRDRSLYRQQDFRSQRHSARDPHYTGRQSRRRGGGRPQSRMARAAIEAARRTKRRHDRDCRSQRYRRIPRTVRGKIRRPKTDRQPRPDRQYCCRR